MSDIYCHPEEFGLKQVFEVDFGGGYDYDKFVVWGDPLTGELVYATESGCSCPSPFEAIVERAEPTQARNADDIEQALRAWGKHGSYRQTSIEDVYGMREAVKKFLASTARKGAKKVAGKKPAVAVFESTADRVVTEGVYSRGDSVELHPNMLGKRVRITVEKVDR